MTSNVRLLAAVAVLTTFATAVYGLGRMARRSETQPLVRLRFGAHELRVGAALTAAEQARGLAGRLSLGPDEGLLFVFPSNGYPSFWMKGMRFPIDIVWLSDDWQVLGINADIRPESFPAMYVPSLPVRYVLETNAHWAEQHGVSVGARPTIVGSAPVLY